MNSNKLPLISIIIPYYNGEKYIEEAISSALAQTYINFEIILVDDGSSRMEATTYLENLVTALNDSRIKYFYKKNEGLSCTRNFAILKSSGEWIAILDQDDTWDKSKLKKQVELIQQNNKVVLVYTDAILFHEKSGKKNLMSIRVRPYKGSCFKNLLECNFLPCSSVIFNKEVALASGLFNVKYKFSEEWDLFLKMLEDPNHEIDYVPEPLFIYRLHDSNSSHLLFNDTITEFVNIISRYKNDRNFNNKYSKSLIKALVSSYYLGSLKALRQGEFRVATTLLFKSVKTSFLSTFKYAVVDFFYRINRVPLQVLQIKNNA
ncbi:MAG: glycosyltransferase [Oligoflexia bacterium]|nr:glycosyltransferase [Oligoflexia bacterium]